MNFSDTELNKRYCNIEILIGQVDFWKVLILRHKTNKLTGQILSEKLLNIN